MNTTLINKLARDIVSLDKIAIKEETQQFIEWALIKRDKVSTSEIFKFLERQGVPLRETAPSKKGLPLAKGEMVEVKAEKAPGNLQDILGPLNGEIATVDDVDGDDVILRFQHPKLRNNPIRIDGGTKGPKAGLFRYTSPEAALTDGRSANLFEVIYVSDENAKPPSKDQIRLVQEYIDNGLDKGEKRSRVYYTGLVLGIYTNKEGEQYFKIFSQQRDTYPRAMNPEKGTIYYIGRLNKRPGGWQSEYDRMMNKANLTEDTVKSSKLSRVMPKYPEIQVKLTGQNGNAFLVLGIVSKALKSGGVPSSEISQFREECMSGDYDNLLRTCMSWVTVR